MKPQYSAEDACFIAHSNRHPLIAARGDTPEEAARQLSVAECLADSIDKALVEIRYQTNIGETEPHLDEVVVRNALHFHLEQMNDGHWWMSILQNDGHTVTINLSTKRGARIWGRAEEDV